MLFFSFVNYANVESCQSAIQHLNGFSIKNFTLSVSHAIVKRIFVGSTNEKRWFFFCLFFKSQMKNRIPRSNSTEEPKPIVGNQTNSSRSVTSQIRSDDSQRFSAVDENLSVTNDELVPLGIKEHELLKENQTIDVYLLHYESPSLIYVATLNDYIRLKLLEMKMSDHEKLGQTKANSYRDPFVSKFSFIQNWNEILLCFWLQGCLVFFSAFDR